MYSDSRDNMDDPDVSFEFSFTIFTVVYPQMYICFANMQVQNYYNYLYFIQLTQYVGPQEYGLNKNVDVTLWLESRNFKNYPPLREVHNFVIINEQLQSCRI